MKKNLKFTFYFGVIAIIAYVISVPYMMAVSKPTVDQLNEVGAQITTTQLVLGSGINLVIMALVFSFIGITLSSKVGLKWDWIQSLFEKSVRPKWDRTYVSFSVLWGILATLLIYILTAFVFAPHIPQLAEVNQDVHIPWWAGLTTIFQGGISEELMMRFGLMTLLVWILSKIFMRKKDAISPWIYWVAIVGAAILFGAGHLPTAQAVYGGLTPLLILYILLGNGLAGIGFGFLYWKKGLEYAIVSHITADFMLHFVIQQFGSLFTST